MYEMKKEFKERIEKQIGKRDAEKFFDTFKQRTRKAFRVNTIKANSEDIKERIKERGWKFRQIPGLNGAFIIDTELNPGELGKTIEHNIGGYYIQEITSMLPALALNPQENEKVLDLCAAPGSKTTQIAALMNNKGILFANEVRKDRVNILSTNLERCGVANTIVTNSDGLRICKFFRENKYLFDKILVDAPCSGEGTIMNDPSILRTWNPNMIKKFSRIQKGLIESAFNTLVVGGTLVYSTCTLEVEEDEEVIQYLIDKFPKQIKVEKISLPLKSRSGLKEWDNKKFDKEILNCAKFWPQDNGSEGFFIARIRKIE
ncbi:RsmB/NOP family class I SAM-dependent RNA methyltransferase [Candidatus Pacearchaeota archaeon]|nr:RsmB/NOP family class I SAM-dependent RNA methyltransferase [Candidatus Pacearchaeota archaeon]